MNLFSSLLRTSIGAVFFAVVVSGAEPAPQESSRDSAGNTPLHLAARQDDADRVDALLAAGADPNATNDAGATPLHYSVTNERIVTALLAHRAKPDVVSKQGVTPLLGAVGRPNSFAVAKRLIDAGANINAQRQTWSGILGNASVLTLAVANGDSRTVDYLLERHAELNPPVHSPVPGAKTGTTPLIAAALVGDVDRATDLLNRGAEINAGRGLAGSALNHALFAGHTSVARVLIERGADLNVPSGRGFATRPMVWSAYNDHGDADIAKLLVSRGIDVNAPNDAGETALSFALKTSADNELVRYLKSIGAKAPALVARDKSVPSRSVPAEAVLRNEQIRSSAQRAIDLLQVASTTFLQNGFVRQQAKCVSCHQQGLPAVAFGLTQARGLKVDERDLGRLVASTVTVRSTEVENARQLDEPTPGRGVTLGYDADGLSALRYKKDGLMEDYSRYLLATQQPEGGWQELARRPPIEDSPIVMTAWSLRAIQLYPPTGSERAVSESMRRAREWLAQQPIHTHNDRVFQLLGLAWADETHARMKPLVETLLADQRADGGWAQLPGREADAWATGSALVALQKAGVPVMQAGYQRGVDFLLRTQFDDGSWWVRSRSWPFQPHFNGKFPHGKDQWISTAGTAWATIALLLTVEPTVAQEQLPTGQQLIGIFEKASKDRLAQTTPARDAKTEASKEIAAIDFGRDIKPIFERSCAGCHGGARPKAGLTFESREALLKGGQSGEAAILPGDAEASPLFRQLSGLVEDLEMPPLSRREKYPALSASELEQIRAWINAGAPWTPVQTVAGRSPATHPAHTGRATTDLR